MQNEKIVQVNPDEDSILDVLDDTLFAGDLAADDLIPYQNLSPLNEIDVLIGAAINRALNLSIPEGSSRRPKVLQ